MKFSKKAIVAITLASTLMFSLVECGSSNSTSSSSNGVV